MSHVTPANVPASRLIRTHQLVALAALLALLATAAVLPVVLISGTDETDAGQAAPLTQTVNPSPGVRYDGGPDEGSHGIRYSSERSVPATGARYDGGPEEGSRGLGR